MIEQLKEWMIANPKLSIVFVSIAVTLFMTLITKYTTNQKRYIALFFVLLFAVLFMNQASAITAVVNVPERYSEISAGERVYFETNVKWPENTERKDLRIEYSVQNQEGHEIAYLKVLKAIETQASFMDSINIPKSTLPGTYYLFIKISDYEDLSQDIGVSFKVGVSSEKKIFFFLYLIIGILGIITFVVLVQIFFLFKRMAR